jgi:hypothetical protein
MSEIASTVVKSANVLTDEQKNTLKGYSRWTKFICILSYISCGFVILVGVPLILALGFGFIYIGLGVLGIWLTNKLRKTAVITKEIAEAESLSYEQSSDRLVSAIEHLRLLSKISGILQIVSIVMILVSMLGFALLIGTSSDFRNGFTQEYDDSSEFEVKYN